MVLPLNHVAQWFACHWTTVKQIHQRALEERLWVARGRDRSAVRPFFDLLGPQGCARIEAVAMDMSGAFGEEVRARCPNAAIVYDLFHVVARYGREVIDRVRVDETNRIARAAGPNRRSI